MQPEPGAPSRDPRSIPPIAQVWPPPRMESFIVPRPGHIRREPLVSEVGMPPTPARHKPPPVR